MELHPCPVCGAPAGHQPGCKNAPPKSLDELIEGLKAKGIGGDERRELIGTAFEALKARFEEMGARCYENADDAYRALSGKEWVVRREATERLLETVSGGDMELAFDPKVSEEYANAVVWNYAGGTRGLQNAFLEGQSSLGGLVTVAIYEKGRDMSVKDIPEHMKRRGDIDRNNVRMVKGTIHPEDVKAIIVAAPAGFFPPELMSDDEREMLEEATGADGTRDPKKAARRIFRAFVFDREAERKDEAA